MKKLFFILIAVLVSVSAFSQTKPSVKYLFVDNKTNCEQYFVVLGSFKCPCEDEHYVSAFITIPPMSTLLLDSSVLANPTTGFGPTTFTGIPDEYIFAVRIRDNHPLSSCNFVNANTIGQPVCATLTSWSFTVKDLNCQNCANTTATWYPDECGGTARLEFN